jgi:PIN like domain
VPSALRDFGWAIETHDDHFAPVTKDVDLFPAVAAEGWVFLTQDARIRYRPAEANALREAGLKTFVLVTANLSAERTVEILEKARRRIERVALREDAPFIYRVGKDGSVKRVG